MQLPARPAGIGQWPARWLVGLGTPWNTLQLGGTIKLASPGLTLQSVAGRMRLAGALDLQLIDASSRVSAIDPLGSYRISLRAAPAGAAASGATPGAAASGATPGAAPAESAALTLDTVAGALRLSGSGQWNGEHLRFRGEARADEGQEAGLSNLLNIIGRRQGALSVISIG